MAWSFLWLYIEIVQGIWQESHAVALLANPNRCCSCLRWGCVLWAASVYLLLPLTCNFGLLMCLVTLPSAGDSDLKRMNYLGRVLVWWAVKKIFWKTVLNQGAVYSPLVSSPCINASSFLSLLEVVISQLWKAFERRVHAGFEGEKLQ